LNERAGVGRAQFSIPTSTFIVRTIGHFGSLLNVHDGSTRKDGSNRFPCFPSRPKRSSASVWIVCIVTSGNVVVGRTHPFPSYPGKVVPLSLLERSPITKTRASFFRQFPSRFVRRHTRDRRNSRALRGARVITLSCNFVRVIIETVFKQNGRDTFINKSEYFCASGT